MSWWRINVNVDLLGMTDLERDEILQVRECCENHWKEDELFLQKKGNRQSTLICFERTLVSKFWTSFLVTIRLLAYKDDSTL